MRGRVARGRSGGRGRWCERFRERNPRVLRYRTRWGGVRAVFFCLLLDRLLIVLYLSKNEKVCLVYNSKSKCKAVHETDLNFEWGLRLGTHRFSVQGF